MHASTPSIEAAPSPGAGPRPGRPVIGWPARLSGALSAALGTVAGITPHVLHHIGPLAGAAILAGTLGSVLFGVIGFVLTVPLLIRLKRRFGSWVAPGLALALFIVMFTVSTLWIGPWIRGEDQQIDTPTDPHHPASLAPGIGQALMLPSVRSNIWASPRTPLPGSQDMARNALGEGVE